MKSAIVGLGVIGKVHKQLINKLGFNLTAVCDIDQSKLQGLDDIKAFDDYVTMLNDVKPDVVHICTPHYLHAEMICEGLQRNINVLCEKPLAINESQLEQIEKAVQKSKAQLGVCFQNRYNAAL